MISRDLNPLLEDSLNANDPFIYFHLVKFEKPKPSGADGASTELPTDYAYITDAPYNIVWDVEGDAVMQTYVANKLISVGAVQESTQARATTISLKLSSNALNTSVTSRLITVTAGYFVVDIDMAAAGFSEGDKVDIGGIYVRLDKFALGSVPNSKVFFTDIDGGVLATTTNSIVLVSEEISALTLDKSNPLYSNYINREVYIYKAHADPSNGEIYGKPFLLYKGIIAQGSIKENPESDSTITWGLSSHWGDFVRVQGRITSDSSHRALSMTGKSDQDALVRPEYEFDYGFAHADSSVNVLATYQTEEVRYKMVKKGGLSGWLGGKKMREYYETVDNEVDLRFNLSSKYLPVVYGVQKVSSIPIFADISNSTVSDRGNIANSADLYVAYALCEGPIGGIYDIHIDDQPTVCSDLVDYDIRGWGVAAAEDVEVVCYGRADKGFVLSGASYSTGTNIKWQSPPPEDAEKDYKGRTGQFRRSREPDIANDPINDNGSIGGIQHETAYVFDSPINASFTLHSGKADQDADVKLVEKASKKEFKIQNDYYAGDVSNYWGTSHSLLDTAYVSANFIVTEEQTTIPTYNFVIKGKFTDCYNYDGSYKTFINNNTFSLGDKVDIYPINAAGDPVATPLHTNITVIDKWDVYDENDVLDVRYRFSTLYPDNELGDSLVNLTPVPGGVTYTRFKIVAASAGSGASGVECITWDYETADSGVLTAPSTTILAEATVGSVEDTGVFYNTLTIPLGTGNALHNYLATYAANDIVIGINTLPGYFFTVESYNSGTWVVTLEAQGAAIAVLENNLITGSIAYIANFIRTGSSNDITVGSEVVVYRTVNGIVEKVSKIVRSKDDALNVLYTGNPFSSTFIPGLLIDPADYTVTTTSTDTYTTVIGSDKRVSINPAIQLLDYLTSTRYGRGLNISSDIDKSTFFGSARLCDDRSKVSLNTLTVLNPFFDTLAVYRYPAAGALQFQGTITGITSTSTTSFVPISYDGSPHYEATFDHVIGKLGRKWNDWKSDWAIGDLIWKGNNVYVSPIAGNIPEATIDGWTPVSSITLTNISGGSPDIVVNLGPQGGVSKSNPIVRAWSIDDEAFSLPGYSLYDSDNVKYWKYVGWDEHEQRYATRHQMNQIIDTSIPIFDNINSMLTQFNGMLRYVNGYYELDIKTGAARDPDLDYVPGIDRIYEADILGGIKVDDKGQKGSYNSISTNIIDPQNKFEARALSFFDSTYLKQDKGVPKQGTYSLPGITNYYNARLNIAQYLNESRYGITASFKMDPKGYQLLAGKTMLINYDRLGWTDKVFRVDTLTLEPDSLVSLTVKEHNDSAYLIDYSDRTSMDNIDIGTPGGGPNSVLLDAITSLTTTSNRVGEVVLNWTSPQYIIDKEDTYEVNIYAAEALRNSELTDAQNDLTYPNPSPRPGDIYDVTDAYARTTAGDPNGPYQFMGNEFANAEHIATVSGQSYAHDTLLPGAGSNSFRKMFYWVKVVRKAEGTVKRAYSPVFPDITQEVSPPTDPITYVTAGVEGTAYDQLNSLVVDNTNAIHTLPVSSESTGAIISYTGSGTDISVLNNDDVLRYAGDASVLGTVLTPNSWRIDSIDVPDTGVAGDDIVLGAVTTFPDPSNPLNPANTLMQLADYSVLESGITRVIVTFNISGIHDDGTNFTDTIIQDVLKGVPGAPVVILEADTSVIVYDSLEENPVPPQVHLTALAYNINTPRYKYTNVTLGTVITDGVNPWTLLATNTWESPLGIGGYAYHDIKVEIADADADGDLTGDPAEILAEDTIRVSLVAGGGTGLNAISIFNSNSNHTIVEDDVLDTLDYTNSGTTIKVYEGNTALTLIDPGIDIFVANPGEWKFDSIVVIPTFSSGAIPSLLVGSYVPAGTSAVIGPHSELLVDSVLIVYTIDIKRLDGTYVNDVVTTQSIDKKGQAVNIFADTANISYESDWSNPSPSAVNISTTQLGFDNPLYRFEFTRFNTLILSPGPLNTDWSATSVWNNIDPDDPVNEGYELKVQVFARESNDATITDEDIITIPVTRDGTDGVIGLSTISGYLSNQAHILAAESDGTGYDLTGVGGTFHVYNGTTEVTSSALFYVLDAVGTQVEPDVGGLSEFTANGLKMSINNVTGAYELIDNLGLPIDPTVDINGAAFKLRATYNAVNIDIWYTLRLSLGGADAKLLTISSTSQTFAYDSDGVLVGDPTITFTAIQENSDVGILWYSQIWNGVDDWVMTVPNWMVPTPGSGNLIATLSAADFISEGAPAMRVWASFRDPIIDGPFYIDTITVIKIRDGRDGTFYYIKPLDGTVIKNGDPGTTLRVEAHKVSGLGDVLLSGGDMKLYVGGDIQGTGYEASYTTADITNSILIELKDPINDGTTVRDTITLVDIADGGDAVYGYISASNGLAFVKKKTGIWDPNVLDTNLTANFVSSGVPLTSGSVLVTKTDAGILNTTQPTYSGLGTPPYISAVATNRGTQALTVAFTYDDTVNPPTSVGETVLTTIEGTDGNDSTVPGPIGPDGPSPFTLTLALAGSQTLSFSKSAVGVWSPSGATTFLTGEVRQGGPVIAFKQVSVAVNDITGALTPTINTGHSSLIDVTTSGGGTTAVTITWKYTPVGDTVVAQMSQTVTSVIAGAGSTGTQDADLLGGRASGVSVTSAIAGWYLYSNGIETRRNQNTYTPKNTWLNNGLATDYQALATHTGGGDPSGTFGSWITLGSSNIGWTYTYTGPLEISSSQISLKIRHKTTFVVLDTCNVNLVCTYEG